MSRKDEALGEEEDLNPSVGRRAEDQEGEQEVGFEGAAQEDAGLLRHEPVEGGDELSIGGGPPSAAGGERNSRLPTRDDFQEP